MQMHKFRRIGAEADPEPAGLLVGRQYPRAAQDQGIHRQRAFQIRVADVDLNDAAFRRQRLGGDQGAIRREIYDDRLVGDAIEGDFTVHQRDDARGAPQVLVDSRAQWFLP